MHDIISLYSKKCVDNGTLFLIRIFVIKFTKGLLNFSEFYFTLHSIHRMHSRLNRQH